MFFDYVSDLHIDHWNKKYHTKNPHEEVKDLPFNFKNKKSDILIIAGDTSDKMSMTIDYIKTEKF
jgi:hypothetical protein